MTNTQKYENVSENNYFFVGEYNIIILIKLNV